MKRIAAGILAHVDAGKTTLSESMLYLSGEIRKAGRVDHGDAFLDTYEMEKERGITIFSKQAVIHLPDTILTLLDTPGHVDFSSEMERTLQVLDYAILVISGADGVQGHTRTLWRLLERYEIPTFLFINKMDQEGTDRQALYEDIKKHLSESCVVYDPQEMPAFYENLATCDERAMDIFLQEETLPDEEISRVIHERKAFPCLYGSALRMDGVRELLEFTDRYMIPTEYPPDFAARVYKIARDDKGSRLTYMKITGGTLKVKQVLEQGKADQIRIYSGARYEAVQEAEAGTVCAVTGLSDTFCGQGLGLEKDAALPVLSPVLDYRIRLPENVDVHVMLARLKELEEEDPQLHIVWDARLQEIHAMLMGEVQTEILKKMIWERFHTVVEFDAGSIVYKETISNIVEGVGHFEPLRHYAEVHLLLEPGETGSGLQFFTACSEDVLDRNWQRLILTHLSEKEHRGVLTGAPITDMAITLLTGRAHIKHTEGGDFRQATYRAVRMGLRKAESVLLEPVYEFMLEIPSEYLGRAISDIQRMQGSMDDPEPSGEGYIIKGRAAVSEMRDYQLQVAAYTRGTGRLFTSLAGYQPCKDQDEIVKETGYDPEADLDNPTGSVFCAHGAGFVVPWYEVEEHMHVESGLHRMHNDTGDEDNDGDETDSSSRGSSGAEKSTGYVDSYAGEKELMEIFERTYGPVRRRLPSENAPRRVSVSETEYKPGKNKKPQDEYLLVDGYNMIFAWEELRTLAKDDIHLAQSRLKDILSNYQPLRGGNVIVVFDAYRVEGHQEEIQKYHNIYVVYTKEADKADQYIEKTVHKIGRSSRVTVATSDGLEQIIILGQGAARLSADGLHAEIRSAVRDMHELIGSTRKSSNTFLMEEIPQDVAEYLAKKANSGPDGKE